LFSLLLELQFKKNKHINNKKIFRSKKPSTQKKTKCFFIFFLLERKKKSTMSNLPSPVSKHHQQHNHNNNNNSKANCSVCSERGFVTKTATPYFPHKEPPPPPPPPKTCHGCVERSAILNEVAGLREMAFSLSNAVLELNEKVSVQKQRIADLESEVQDQKRITATQFELAAHPRPTTTTNGNNNNNNSDPTQISSLLEKMLQNQIPAIEARILANVRRAEQLHNSNEFKNIRDDLQRKSNELQRDFEKSVRNLDSQWHTNDVQLKEVVAQQDRRMRRAFHQLSQALGVAAPPALSNNSANNSIAGGVLAHNDALATSEALENRSFTSQSGGGGGSAFGASITKGF
jgi:hypothetical protein